jgi:cytochrome P450
MTETIAPGGPTALAELPDPPRIGYDQLFKRLLHPERERVDMLAGLQEVYEAHGNVASMNVLSFRMVNLYGPDANRLVLLDKDRIFSARRPWMTIMGRIFPNGLLLMDGEQHRWNRKMMREAFKRPILRGYAQRMNPMIAEGIESWHQPGRPFLAFPAVKELTLDMAARIFVGVDLGPETRRMNGAFEDLVAASMSRIRLPIPGLEFQRGLKARQFMIDFIGSRITEKRAGDTPDIFAQLCRAVSEEGDRLEDQQIIDHMSFLMMAAHDTTTSALSSILFELGRHREWQERVREECLGRDSDDLGYDDLEALETLGWVMKEALRRYPPLPVIPRIAEEDFEFDGRRIRKDSMVVVSPIFTHHMPEWWDEPRRFDPARFSPERAEHERHTHHWIPFGGGPHMCIGLRFAETQVKLILHHLVRRYRWSVPDGYEMPVQQAPISKPMDGLPLRLEPLS